VFQALEEPVRAKTCHGIRGIVEEGKMAIDELEEGPLLDAAIIAGAQKVEHYEIASYGTLAFFAEILGESEAHDLLGESLEEEKAADEKLNEIAMSKVNREALQQSGDQEEEEDDEAQNQTGSSSRSGSRSGGQKSGARSSNRTGTRAASGRR
jgi:ferritin-like metal-binding protein YciE